MQLSLRHHFLHEYLASLSVSDESKATLRRALGTIPDFESKCSGNVAWIGVLEVAAQRFQRLVQTVLQQPAGPSLEACTEVPDEHQ